MPPSSYFDAKSYQSESSGTISPTTDAIGSLVSEDAAFDLHPRHELLDEHLLVVAEGEVECLVELVG